MKLLFVNQDEGKSGQVFRYFTPLGYALIHYSNPLKAIDNYKEIRPEVVVFNESDYPRHWKLAVQFLRQLYSRETALFILMVKRDFPEDELNKALLLGVNGVIQASDDYRSTLKSLESLILHYKPSPDVRKHHQLMPLGDQPMDFMFMNPENLQLVTARVLELSQTGAVVKPVEQVKTGGLKEGMEIRGCSLKTGDIILSLTVRIQRIDGIFELEFLEGKEDWKEQVQNTIESYS